MVHDEFVCKNAQDAVVDIEKKLLVFGNMVFALVLAHRSQFFSLTDHGGWALELQGFYLFSGLAILFLGSGRMAIRPD